MSTNEALREEIALLKAKMQTSSLTMITVPTSGVKRSAETQGTVDQRKRTRRSDSHRASSLTRPAADNSEYASDLEHIDHHAMQIARKHGW
jgi:hypothetical protein